MKRNPAQPILIGSLLTALLVPLAAQPAAALDERDGDEKKLQDDPLLPELPFAEDDPRNEMIELFHEVERKLGEVDVKLGAAGTGEIRLQEVTESGIEKLLRDAEDDGANIVTNIDRILEIAQQMGNGT